MMQFRSCVFLVGLTFALAGGMVYAQGLPSVPGMQGATKAESGGQDVSTAAKQALNNVKSARSNISKKDYVSAKTDVSNARTNLKSVESNTGLGQSMGSPVSKVDKYLGDAEQALGNKQPKAADNLLKKAEGPLQAMG